ncbi:hypothetical protein B0T22DRAFT_469808 [Podospora appendiculata]|uniref:YCII-related domain-containing protein n=1 Tax=Podospora appendiculata TaxID=314037 RepID=A0AAE1C9K6_9PEZI|nr:hypothetical protein B0T22DRAFT_469808 [Podospora appendiculata]
MPRYMILVLANASTEAGSTAVELLEMGKFNDSLREAGLLQAAEGLAPTIEGYRVSFGLSEAEVEKGPFDLEKQGTISGFWFVKADSIEVVLEFAKKVPFKEGQVEVRRVAGADDFGEELLAEMREGQNKLRGEK